MEPTHTRNNECGCIERWYRQEHHGQTTYLYSLTVCPVHWKTNHLPFLESFKKENE